MYGGRDTSVSISHATPEKNGWARTSSAPPAFPSLVLWSLSSSRSMRSVSSGILRRLSPGNSSSLCRTFRKVSLRFAPLNGVRPNAISWTSTPTAHQSTANPCPSPRTISGATYSSDFPHAPPPELSKLPGFRLTGDTRADLVFFAIPPAPPSLPIRNLTRFWSFWRGDGAADDQC
nr:unnamed protein product [Digitaria exilis]